MAATLVWVLGVPMVLRLLKEDMDAWALAAALASFTWLVLLVEWTRSQEGDFYATESHRLGSTAPRRDDLGRKGGGLGLWS